MIDWQKVWDEFDRWFDERSATVQDTPTWGQQKAKIIELVQKHKNY